jgi:hypothetical protein
MKIISTSLKYKLDPEPRPSKIEGGKPYFTCKFEDAGQVQAMFLPAESIEAAYARTLAAGASIQIAKDDKGYKLLIPDAETALAAPTTAAPVATPQNQVQVLQDRAVILSELYENIYNRLKLAGIAQGDLSSATATVFIQAAGR